MMEYKGGCLCGAVRYASQLAPDNVGYCHCRLCQLSSGAPVSAWASFPLQTFQYTHGTPNIFKSSAHGQREFCGVCGSQLLFRNTVSVNSVDVNIGTLDKPTQVEPEYHIWTESQLKWFEIADNLPRHKQEEPDTET